jgi:catechol 2,3-dioxygenase-like lactoylglutathione lyase family enzyme
MISHIDHFVLTVRSLDATCRFYERVLGFMRVDIAGLPTALTFGHQKINLHEAGRNFEPAAAMPTVGSGDFCLIADRPLAEFRAHLEAEGVAIELGPVERTGAQGTMTSIYFRDPDGNLIEVSEYDR